MKESEVAYLAGVVDSVGLFRIKVEEDDEIGTGYLIRPQFRIHRSGSQEIVFGMLDEYCEEQNVRYMITESTTTTQFYIREPDHIRRFMEPLAPHIIQLVEQMSIYMGEVLPAIEDEQHHDKRGFVDLMETVDEMYAAGKAPRKRKYDAAFFKNEWADELE